MDIKDASEKVKAIKKPDTTLVCFLGDNEFGWFPPENLVPFQEHYDEKKRQKGGKSQKVVL
jgi:DNA (cytosine-5)-methyltransferase 3A